MLIEYIVIVNIVVNSKVVNSKIVNSKHIVNVYSDIYLYKIIASVRFGQVSDTKIVN